VGTSKNVDEIRDQRQIVRTAKVDRQHISGNRVMAIGHASLRGVLRCDRQHRFPIERGDLGLLVGFRDRDPKQAMTGGDIQDSQAPGVLHRQQVGKTL
jgi:hypothetical protein